MIYTVTMNPSLDYVMHVGDFSLGTIMRSDSVSYHCGGKGINVSIVLGELGVSSCALGFIAGTVGSVIEDKLVKMKISTDFVHLKSGESRINVKIRSSEETDINAQGPYVSESNIDELLKKLHNAKSGDIIVLSGSIPKGIGNDIYGRIMQSFDNTGVRFIVDASGSLLSCAIGYKPFLIKPNDDELAEIFGRRAETEEEIALHAKELQKLGAENVLVSRGSKGSLLFTHDGEVLTECGVSGRVVNTVGAGDSMVAGFIAGYISDGSFETALRLGSAAGGATALSEGLASRKSIYSLL